MPNKILKCESKNAEQTFSTVLFVIFRDHLIPIAWKSLVLIKAKELLEKDRSDIARRKRVLRESQIRSIHQVGELKRAQEVRMDEFSRNELGESHATIQELTSQIQEMQERENYIIQENFKM